MTRYPKFEEEHQHHGPEGQLVTHVHVYGHSDHPYLPGDWRYERITARCAQCGLQGPAVLFEPFNAAGNVACKATTACALRQQGTNPAELLGTLLRELSRGQGHSGVGSELEVLTPRQLAELEYDLNGDGTDEYGGGFHAALQARMTGKGAVFAEVVADRLARKRRRAALRAAETRRANRAAG